MVSNSITEQAKRKLSICYGIDWDELVQEYIRQTVFLNIHPEESQAGLRIRAYANGDERPSVISLVVEQAIELSQERPGSAIRIAWGELMRCIWRDHAHVAPQGILCANLKDWAELLVLVLCNHSHPHKNART